MTGHLSESELNDLIDGRLAPGEQTRAIRHLADCQRCVEERDALAHVVTISQSARTPLAAPDELWTLVSASTIHERALRRRVLRSMRGVLVVGALALVAATAAVTLWVARGASGLFPSAPGLVMPDMPPMPDMPAMPDLPPMPPLPPAPPSPRGESSAEGIEHARQMAEEARRHAEEAMRRAEEAMRRADDMRRAAEERARQQRRP